MGVQAKMMQALDGHLRSLRYTASECSRLLEALDFDEDDIDVSFSGEEVARLRRDAGEALDLVAAAVDATESAGHVRRHRDTWGDSDGNPGTCNGDGGDAQLPTKTAVTKFAPSFGAIGEERATIGGTVFDDVDDDDDDDDLKELEDEILGNPGAPKKKKTPRSPESMRREVAGIPKKPAPTDAGATLATSDRALRAGSKMTPDRPLRRVTIHHRKPQREASAMPKRASTCQWGGGGGSTITRGTASHYKLKRRAARFKQNEEAAFRSRVCGLYQRYGKTPFDKACVKRLMITLGRDARDRVVGTALETSRVVARERPRLPVSSERASGTPLGFDDLEQVGDRPLEPKI
jgi:hypothetical protein